MVRILGLAAALMLGGCAAIVTGSHQELAINTTPAGADCAIERDGASIGKIQSTPGTAMIERTKADLTIVCRKAGYQQASSVVKSGLEPWTYGNLVLGHVVGVGVDMASGSWNKYQSPTNLTLQSLSGQIEAPSRSAMDDSAATEAVR
jgi:hypothetical protein